MNNCSIKNINVSKTVSKDSWLVAYVIAYILPFAYMVISDYHIVSLIVAAIMLVIVIFLTNEKYKGTALLQKRFTVDFLTKTMKKNEGEVPQYLVERSHEPIIKPDEWNTVQKEFARRKALGRSYSGNSIVSSRIICGDCGSFYGSKVRNSTNKYRRTIWQCNAKFKGDHKCTTPHLD